jgi:hypothetical protein
MNMKGIKSPIHEALIELVVIRQTGKEAFAQFKCTDCKHQCTIPREGESKTSFKCCRCDVINYLDNYEVVVR